MLSYINWLQKLRTFLGIVLTFSMFVSVLKSLYQTQGFIHGATHRQVIDGDLPQDALVVNHKQTPERHKLRL